MNRRSKSQKVGGLALGTAVLVALVMVTGSIGATTAKTIGGGGGGTNVTYIYEGPSGIGATINGVAVVTGSPVILTEGSSVPVQYTASSSLYGWACNGGGSFKSPGSASTIFTVGTGGYIYIIDNQGQNIWGGYILGQTGSFVSAQADIQIPQASTFGGTPGNVLSLWVGLGGWPAGSPLQFPLWQAGVSIEETGSGPAQPVLWYEAFQSWTHYQTQQSVPLSDISVTFGQYVLIQLSFNSAGGYVCFTVAGEPEYCTEDTFLYVQGSGQVAWSAEWVAEAPAEGSGGNCGGAPCYPIPNFGTVTFFNLGAASSYNGSPWGEVGLVTLSISGSTDPNSGGPSHTIPQTLAPHQFVTGDLTPGFTMNYNGPA